MTTTLTAPMLTQLRLNPRSSDAGRDLTDVDRMHRRVMTMFPDDLGDSPRVAAGVLYRVEYSQTGPVVLVQSSLEPTLDQLPSGYVATSPRDLTPLLDRFAEGLSVRFRIVANPTRIHTTNGKKQRQHLRGDDAISWWHRRACEAGLDVHSTVLTREDLLSGTRHKHGTTGKRFHHGAAQFDGLATITDPAAARHAVLDGIGRAKSYGCGLLSLHPMGH